MTSDVFRWGIWGTGDISRKFALGLNAASNASLAWVLSRDQHRADEFARRVGAAIGLDSFADAAEIGADAVYIATPAHLHAEHAITALEANLPTLIEKPFSANIGDAQQILKTAREKQVFAMEAMWTRFQPNVIEAKKLVTNGKIGTPRLLRGEVCIASLPGGSLYDMQGGGALRQRGVYPLSLASYFLGLPEDGSAILRFGSSGIDEEAAVQLQHANGAISQIRASTTTTAPNTFEILGDKGALRFEGRIWRPSAVHLKEYKPRNQGGSPGKLADFRETNIGQSAQRALMPLIDRIGRHRIVMPSQGNGYNYQAEEMMNRIANGELESPLMPLSESLSIIELMDRMISESQSS